MPNLSSSCLAAAIGCPIDVGTLAEIAETTRAATAAAAAVDQDDHSDQQRGPFKTDDSTGSLFRMGLELGHRRFRGAGVV